MLRKQQNSLALLLLSVFVYKSSCLRLEPPIAQAHFYKRVQRAGANISYKKLDSNGTLKHSFANDSSILLLECTAIYPIEWISSYGKYFTQGETFRHSKIFEEPSSYQYKARRVLSASVNQNEQDLLHPVHFTCKSTQSADRELQSHVYMTTYNESLPFYTLELTSERKSEYLDVAFDMKAEKCEDGGTALQLLLPDNPFCWTCGQNFPGFERDLSYVVRTCSKPRSTKKIPKQTPQDIITDSASTSAEAGFVLLSSLQLLEGNTDTMCSEKQSMVFMDNNLPNRIFKIVYLPGEVNKTAEVCFVIELTKGTKFSPRLEVCYAKGSLPRYLRDEEYQLSPAPQLHFQWSHMDADKMLFIHPLTKKVVFVGEEIIIKCEYSRFYFSLGSWFAVKDSSGQTVYHRALDRKGCTHNDIFTALINEEEILQIKEDGCSNSSSDFITVTSTLSRKFHAAGHYEIFCFAPLWNSTEWMNASVSIVLFNLPPQQTPKISIKSKADEENAQSQSLEKVRAPNWNAVIFLDCKAPYPIEWIFHHNQNLGNETKAKVTQAETRREVARFLDPSTYSYTASATLEYIGEATNFFHFTCAWTQLNIPKLQTHVYVTEADNGTVLQFQVSIPQIQDEKDSVVIKGPETIPERVSYFIKELDHECLESLEIELTDTDFLRFCWSCTKINAFVRSQTCRTPIQCNSLHIGGVKNPQCVRSRGWGQCGEYLDNLEERDACTTTIREDKRMELRYGLAGCPLPDTQDVFKTSSSPKFVQCVDEQNNAREFGLFYFTIFDMIGKNSKDELPHYRWGDVGITEMLYMHPLKGYYPPGEAVEVKCEYSRLHFSLGTWIGVKTATDDIEYFPALDMRPCDTEAERQQATLKSEKDRVNCDPSQEANQRGTITATFSKVFEVAGNYQVFCFGPVWNTTSWVNTTRSFVVLKWEEPQVLSIKPVGNNKIYIGDKNRKLECKFKGHPPPEVWWNFTGQGEQKTVSGNSISTLFIDKVDYSSAGNYTCHVKSFNATHSRIFNVKPETPPPPPLSPIAITAIVIACMAVLVGLIALFARMWETIREQRKALRLLSDDEVKEFMEGLPDDGSRKENEYIDNVGAIDALPYDDKYEIPLDRLVINFASPLGSGEYGLILKAKLLPQKTLNYTNLAMKFRAVGNAIKMVKDGEEAEAPLLEIDVAVKVCKKNLGVEPFKVLLSEVKVMVFMGRHDNIVSLVGASTENIRNREIYIAMELCHHGCLGNFVKKHKKAFINKVKQGVYMNGTQLTAQPAISASAENVFMDDLGMNTEFSTTELIRWTRDIAAGVEYIHSKRVIHGDLALRNVLLTEDFVAKIGDFGLSRRLGEVSIYAKTTECPLPWRSMAIESLQQLHFSVKSDIWSLGVTLWELFTLGNIPYQGMNYTQDFIKQIDDGSLRLSKPYFAPTSIFEFMLMCWESVPEDRPSTVEIKVICDGLLSSSGSS